MARSADAICVFTPASIGRKSGRLSPRRAASRWAVAHTPSWISTSPVNATEMRVALAAAVGDGVAGGAGLDRVDGSPRVLGSASGGRRSGAPGDVTVGAGAATGPACAARSDSPGPHAARLNAAAQTARIAGRVLRRRRVLIGAAPPAGRQPTGW